MDAPTDEDWNDPRFGEPDLDEEYEYAKSLRWTTAEGQKMTLGDMSDRHMNNAIRHLERRIPRKRGREKETDELYVDAMKLIQYVRSINRKFEEVKRRNLRGLARDH